MIPLGSFILILLSLFYPYPGYSEVPLMITIPAPKKWKMDLVPLAYQPEEMGETPAKVAHNLEILPSLFLKRSGGLGQMSVVSFRGQSSRNTRVQIDNIPLQDISGTVNFAPLLGGGTHVREVIPGSYGMRYGNGASGGVILMETPFLPNSTMITAEGGSFDSVYTHVAHQKINAQTSLVIHGEGSRTAGLPQYGKTRIQGERARALGANMATRLEHQIDDSSTIKITARTLENQTKYDRYDTYAHLLPKPQGNLTTNMSLLGVELRKESKALSHTFQGFFSCTKLKSTEASMSAFSMGGAAYEGTYTPSSHLESTLLVGLKEERMRDTSSLKKGINSFYGGWIQKAGFTERLSGECGARLDHYQKFGTHPTYSALLTYSQKNTHLKTSFRTGFLNPNLYDLYTISGFVQGNPSLKSERTRTIDFTLEQFVPNQTMGFQMTPFWTRIQKMIYGTFQNGVHQSINLPGSTTISGVESQAFYTPHDNIKISMTYAYTYFQPKAPSVNSEFPRHKASIRLDYTLMDWNLVPEVLYVGKRSSQGHSLREYDLANLSLKYQINPSTFLFARIDNIFDKHYVQTYDYQTPGRSFYVGTHLYF